MVRGCGVTMVERLRKVLEERYGTGQYRGFGI